ncbi:MAG: hypothetical protein FWG80_04020 [Alphaproteobacteria bacterium]|nr:hypothetical protein [Alphaproteobacteria bacterium]
MIFSQTQKHNIKKTARPLEYFIRAVDKPKTPESNAEFYEYLCETLTASHGFNVTEAVFEAYRHWQHSTLVLSDAKSIESLPPEVHKQIDERAIALIKMIEVSKNTRRIRAAA